MQLLIDTDAFYKLAVGNILDNAIDLFGTDLARCARLPALPYMLRKGRLRNSLGEQLSDQLIPTAESIPALPQPDAIWLNKLTMIQAIDPGEAHIYALAAANAAMVLSGDKRALRALMAIPEYVEALNGRIVVLEAVLVALCDRIGVSEVQRRIQPLLVHDKIAQICFSPSNQNPQEALGSYYHSLAAELDPLALWNPFMGAH